MPLRGGNHAWCGRSWKAKTARSRHFRRPKRPKKSLPCVISITKLFVDEFLSLDCAIRASADYEMPGSVGLWTCAKPLKERRKKGGRAMSYRIAISSLAAVAVVMSCMATDASARGGGGGGGSGGGGSRSGGTAPGVRSSITGPTGGGGYFATPSVRSIPSFTGVGGAASGGGKFAAPGVRPIPRITGVGDPAGSRSKSGGTAPGERLESIIGVGGPTGGGAGGAPRGGVAAGAQYAPASYDSNAACGRYPYPPCNKVPNR